MTTQNDPPDVLHPHCFEPFPQPQTIPGGWDLSGLPSAPQSASDGGVEADPDEVAIDL